MVALRLANIDDVKRDTINSLGAILIDVLGESTRGFFCLKTRISPGL